MAIQDLNVKHPDGVVTDGGLALTVSANMLLDSRATRTSYGEIRTMEGGRNRGNALRLGKAWR